MTRGEIKTAIKNQVDDSTIGASILNEWIQAADDKVQTWRPPRDQDQTFDFWDYLKEEKNYTTQIDITKYPLPDNFRAFVGKEPLRVEDDAEPYTLVDYQSRDKYSDHVIWMLGKSRYYNQQGDTELENQNMNEFERVMLGKWRDQEMVKTAAAEETAIVPKQFII